ncbi:heme ABC transporter permease [Larsenimonas suaedae]|uniref:Heme exporter protein C n=1 Tax=Larsenimonas suaedae TaxID=1851019 RepID=A0ABU1GU28_9GAMM|nr:heme ABC transporter permease [Larsenimonas suaedae]MCM2971982.1 heme ABC transporter permease [Larsenimonas suaedae]MDR5895534.1 heme ABC transporter permease [Larsenimonas suaedae]
MWQWIHKWASPKHFYRVSTRGAPWLWGLALILLPVGALWGLAFAPADYQQHDSFRIIYVHVPSAMLAESCFALMAVCAVVFLVWKIKLADIVAKVAAPFGASMTFAALFSGAVWGIPTWGTWWVWDARLTSMLILLFLYFGIIALRYAFAREHSGGRAAAVLSLVGVVNLPIIKYSVEWWNTLHQTASFSLTKAPSMPESMWVPLLLMMLGAYALFGAVVLSRTRNEILRREHRARWVRALITDTCDKEH